MADANCRGKPTRFFFPERGESQRHGKAICGPCTVQAACSEYSERTRSNHGMWGGEMKQRRSGI